jgi:hypothetical protein
MRVLKWVGMVYFVMATVIFFWGCEGMKSPTESNASIQKKKNKNFVSTETHWETEKIIKYRSGGTIKIDKLFSFKVKPKSMSPGEDTPIFCEIDLQGDGTLLFHFEPSLEFNPYAEFTLKWHKINVGEYEILKLYLIEDDGNKVLMSTSNDNSGPYEWDKTGKIVRFEIPHFTLYALSKD